MRSALVVLVAMGVAAGSAHAEGTIAVLPLSSPERRLEMYGRPVAKVLATELRAAVEGAPVVEVTLIGDDALPRDVAWVVDGRIVPRGRRRVVVEARLRDPARGSAYGQVASEEGALTDIDRLARDAARKLGPIVVKARAERAAPTPTPTPTPSPIPSPIPSPSPTTTTSTIVIAPDKEPIVTEALAAMVRRLGWQPVVGQLSGVATPEQVKAELTRTGAVYALLHEVDSVDYTWRGVLTARGTFRVLVVDGAGRAAVDEWLETDTLVGSRGDRHAALLGFVARQAADMVAPRLRKVLLK